MNNIYKTIRSNCTYFICLLTFSFFSGINLQAQENSSDYIYSNFASPEGKYIFTGPSCASDRLIDLAAMSDADLNNYAFLSTPQSCSNKAYAFKTKLNLLPGTDCAPDGYAVGFKISLRSKLSLTVHGSNIRLNTYYKGVLSESNASKEMFGLDVLQRTGESWVSFVPTKKVDEVEIVFNDAPIQYTVGFEAKIWYAFAAAVFILPATITDLKVVPAGSNATISWKSLVETNISHYDIQRSGDGVHFGTVANIKPNSNSGGNASYSYTDQLATGGTYFYRINMVNKDGSATTTNYVSISINGNTRLVVYPTILKAGQPLNIKTVTTGAFNIAVYDVQGRAVKQERKTSNGLITVNTAGLAAGTYSVKVVTDGGSVLQSKFIVN